LILNAAAFATAVPTRPFGGNFLGPGFITVEEEGAHSDGVPVSMAARMPIMHAEGERGFDLVTASGNEGLRRVPCGKAQLIDVTKGIKVGVGCSLAAPG